MPARDGTGPLGQGSMTGRGMGPCGRGQQAYLNNDRSFYGRGRGMRLNNRIVNESLLDRIEKLEHEISILHEANQNTIK
jgi:hypothetical protein